VKIDEGRSGKDGEGRTVKTEEGRRGKTRRQKMRERGRSREFLEKGCDFFFG